MRGLSLVAASGGHSSSRCVGLSLSRPLLLRSTGSRRAGSVVVAHGPSCSAPCGILPDQGSNPCPLHWQADSQPLRHQGSPGRWILNHCATREVPAGGFLTTAPPGESLCNFITCLGSWCLSTMCILFSLVNCLSLSQKKKASQIGMGSFHIGI